MLERFERFSLAIFEISRCWHKLAAAELAQESIRTLIELIEGTGTHRHLLLETTLREGNSVISLR